MTDTAFSVFAPAKINLTLHVVGKRSDGYHVLDSLVAFAGVGDWINVKRADTVALEIVGPFAAALSPDPSNNLVLKAAHFLAAASGLPHGAHITLEKNLPVASGIGGGSSDAAATLSALAQLWQANFAHLSGADIAAALGADVPVCLRREPTFMRGIGENLSPAPPLPAAWVVLANPGRPLATKAVFGALQGRFSQAQEDARFGGLANARELAAALSRARNDLVEPACELMPEIGDVLTALKDTDGCLFARMSGSGPTCFGLYDSSQAAGAAAASLQQSHPSWWLAAAPLL